MKTINFYLPLVLVILVILQACRTDEMDVPYGVKIRFQPTSILKSSSDTLIITEAYIAIDKIDFIPDGKPDSTGIDKIVHNGPYTVDILNSTITPGIRWIFVRPGEYNQIILTSVNTLAGNYSLIIKGLLKPAGQSEHIPFEVVTPDAFTLKIRNERGVQIRNNENINLVIEIDLMGLLSELNYNESYDFKQNLLPAPQHFSKKLDRSEIEFLASNSSFRIDDGSIWENETESGSDKDEDKEIDEDSSSDNENENNSSDNNNNHSGNEVQDDSDDENDDDKGNDNTTESEDDKDNDKEDDNNGNQNKPGGNEDDKDDDSDDEDTDKDTNEDGSSDNDSGNSPVDDDTDDKGNTNNSNNDDSGSKNNDNNNGPGNSENAPGNNNNDNSPGNSGNAPGNSNNNGPGNSGNAPGNSNNGGKGNKNNS